MNFLRSVWDFLGRLFSPNTQKAIFGGIRRATPYLAQALEYVRLAELVVGPDRTPTKVLRVADQLGVHQFISAAPNDDELRTALRDIVVKALRLAFPGAKTSLLNLAVEIAVSSLRK